jgi:hypothetical protein
MASPIPPIDRLRHDLWAQVETLAAQADEAPEAERARLLENRTTYGTLLAQMDRRSPSPAIQLEAAPEEPSEDLNAAWAQLLAEARVQEAAPARATAVETPPAPASATPMVLSDAFLALGDLPPSLAQALGLQEAQEARSEPPAPPAPSVKSPTPTPRSIAP